MALTMEERIRRFEEYQRNQTPEDFEREAREEEDDLRYIAEHANDAEPDIPWEEIRNELVMEGRLPARGSSRVK